jgi:hypothetical protein
VTQAAADDVRLLTESLAGSPELAARLLKIMAAEIAHFDLLQMPPDTLFGVDLRGIAGETLEVDPFGRPVAKILPDGFAAMDHRAIPDNQQLAWDVVPQMIQEADHLGARDRRLVDLEIESLVQAHGADDREMITAKSVMQDRSLAHGRVGAQHGGQQIEAAFIQEEQRALLLSGLLF